MPHAAVESEALRWAHPALSDEQEMRHVKAMCSLYRRAGHSLMLIGQTIESDDNLARIIDAVGADELAAAMPRRADIDLVLSTEGKLPEAVAKRIREALPDQLGAPMAPVDRGRDHV